jgi:hypothetical protein
MNAELERIWKEVIVIYFKVESSNLPGVTAEINEILDHVKMVSGPRFKLESSRTRRREVFITSPWFCLHSKSIVISSKHM